MNNFRRWNFLVAVAMFSTGAANAHSEQERPASVDIYPQRSFLTVFVEGSGSDLRDAIAGGGHGAAAGIDVKSPEVLEKTRKYFDTHLMLKQGGERLDGKSASLQFINPDSLNTESEIFQARYTFSRDPSLSTSPLRVTSALFDTLSNSRTLVNLAGSSRTLADGKTTEFDGGRTISTPASNVMNWAWSGFVFSLSHLHGVVLLFALLLASGHFEWRRSVTLCSGVLLGHGASLVLGYGGVEIPTLVLQAGPATTLVLAGSLAWFSSKHGSRTMKIPAALVGVIGGLFLGATHWILLREQGLPEVGALASSISLLATTFITLLFLSSVCSVTLTKIKVKFEHDAKYGGTSFPLAAQWISAAVIGLGSYGFMTTFWSG